MPGLPTFAARQRFAASGTVLTILALTFAGSGPFPGVGPGDGSSSPGDIALLFSQGPGSSLSGGGSPSASGSAASPSGFGSGDPGGSGGPAGSAGPGATGPGSSPLASLIPGPGSEPTFDPTAPPVVTDPPLPTAPPAPTPAPTPTRAPTPVPTPAPTVPPPSGPGPTIAGCPVFPATNVWNRPVSGLAVRSDSATLIGSIGASKGFHPDFGSFAGYGIPYNVVSGIPGVTVAFDYADESDPGPYPIPDNPAMEVPSDHHILIVDSSTCRLYETWDSRLVNGAWAAGSGATWDLRSNALRPDGWTSADAAGLPILPGLVRYSEVVAGAINHAIRFTAPTTQRAYIYPARHFASSLTSAALPPMGLRVRLKASYNVATLPAQARVIAVAMQTFGMLLADNGSSWFFQGASDPRFDDNQLNALKAIPGSAFEAVDTTGFVNGG